MLSSIRRVGLAAIVLGVVSTWQAAPAMDPEVTEIVIHPARVPRPALKHRLLPRLSDQVPGVAAPLYAQAFLAMQERNVDDDTWKKMQGQWVNMPLEEFPKEEVREALAQVDAVLRCVEQAARRPRYGLGVPHRDYEQILPTLRTQLEAFRTVARLLLLRIRCRILEGDYEGAIHWLQTGYAMARHCAEQPTALNAMYGCTLVQIMNHELRELIPSPDVPNLYWTITILPDPMVDLEPVFDFESTVLESMFPEFGRAKTVGATPDEWRALLIKVVFSPPWRQAPEGSSGERKAADGRPAVREKDFDALLKKALPVARRSLEAAGVSETELDAMSPAEVAVRAAFVGYQTQCDELAKWCRIPYWQAKAGIHQTVAETGRLLKEAGLPWGEGHRVPPAFSLRHIHEAAARPRRYLAGLRLLEAIRLYAATHDGNLPQRLEDITEVPVPVNPLTGKPFPYRAEERYVILHLDGGVLNRQWWIRLAD